MKTGLILAVAFLGIGVSARATAINIFAPVSPNGNFLYNAPTDTCALYNIPGCNMNATVVNLFANGIQLGDTIQITDVGGLCVYAGANCTVYPAGPSYLGGIFSQSGVVGAAGNANRVTDSVYAGLPDIINSNLNAILANNASTNIPNDFYLGPTTDVTVVSQYLIIGTLDSAFSDNSLGTPSSPGYQGTFGVDILDLNSVPEPGTAALLLAGLGGLLISRRKFRRRA